MWLFRRKKTAEDEQVEKDVAEVERQQAEAAAKAEAEGADGKDFEADDEQPAKKGDAPPTTHIMTEQDKAALAEMKAKLPPDARPKEALDVAFDWTLVRFLRARKYDVAAAIEQYEAMLAWRAENNVDGILAKPDPREKVFQCVCPHRHLGFDRHGHPVYYEMTGQIRVAEMLKHMEEPDIITRHVRYMEYVVQRMIKQSQELGRYVGQCVMIHDMAGMKYSIETAGMRCFRRTTQIDQQYYPECLRKIIIVNAPWSFRGTWVVVRPWLDEKTRGKVEIYGANFRERLQELIPPESLPAEYGGELTCAGEFSNGDPCFPPVRPVSCPDADVPPAWPKIERQPVDLEGGPDVSPAAAA